MQVLQKIKIKNMDADQITIIMKQLQWKEDSNSYKF